MNVEGYYFPSKYVRQSRVHVE